ncbi:hypothetical protein L0F63_000819 [Massospora cicadina]|nr:hypothetical protein L0F63_000819 [Massospora cicadina]
MSHFDGACAIYNRGIDKVQSTLLNHFEVHGDVYDTSLLASTYEEFEALTRTTPRPDEKLESSSKPDPQAEFSRATLEYCLRDFVWSYRARANEFSLGFACLFLLFDFLFFAADQGGCDLSFPLLMIEEISSSASLSELRHIVDYLSDRILIITSQLVPGKGKGLTFLRLCNELQRRCSKVSDAHLVGELKMLLAIAFPINDRSGLNPRGDFDTSNQVKPDLTRLEGFPPDKGVNWSLKIFETNVRDARLKVRAYRKSAEKRPPSVKEESSSSLDAPRHLADISLLPNQMCEPEFQKTILVQFLILFQYLLALTPENAVKMPAAAKPPTGFTWNDQQLHWMTEQIKLINTIMRDIPFGSDKFPRFIKATLKTEPAYAERKSVGAKPVDTAQQTSEATLLDLAAKETEAKLGKSLSSLENMGSATKLAHLWKLGEHNKIFPKGASLKRDRPTLDEFLSEKVRKVEDLEESDQYRQALSWKALRLASKTHVEFVKKASSIDILALKSAMVASTRTSPTSKSSKPACS